MSLRRYCCRQLMRCYADSDALTEVTWYWVPEDRPWIDLPHVFYDRTWQLMAEPPSAVGEQLKHPPYYLGRAPVDADGTHFCGTPAAWRGEASIHDPPLVLSPDTGLPVCCGSQARPLVAGVALGGELVQLPAESVAGGVALGGELVQGLELDGVALGGELVQGLELDGVALGGELVQVDFPTTTLCTRFPLAAAKWRFTLAGLANGACGDCATLNREWVMNFVNNCFWQDAFVTFCGGVARPTLSYQSITDRLLLFFTQTVPVGTPALWSVAANDFDPLGPNVMTLESTTSSCTDWPAAVTIEPAQ